MQSINFGSVGSDSALRRVLDDFGVAYVRGVGGVNQLLQIAESLGDVTEPGVAMPDQAHDGRIYSVHVRNEGKGVFDQHGNVIVSTTHLEFSLHTDAYNRPKPPRYVLLLRVDNGPDDTPSFVSDAQRALKSLSATATSVLSKAAFPAAFGPTALIDSTVVDTPVIRFNQEEIDRWAARGGNPPLSSQARHAIIELGRCLEMCKETRTIQQTDCLILDNSRVCHGRSAMLMDSTRELKRVWVA